MNFKKIVDEAQAVVRREWIISLFAWAIKTCIEAIKWQY
jgi:hypothetical protein